LHEARKALKKARAALRLLRPALGEEVFGRENAALRDAGRRLSPLRDSTSQLNALGALQERHPAKLRRAGLERIQSSLREDEARARAVLLGASGGLGECLRLLRASRARAKKAGLSHPEPRSLRSGLGHVYRQGRKALAEAEKSGTSEALHEWRKQVKYLHNALDAIDGARKGRAAKVAKKSGKLADRLGDDHDLAVLARRKHAPKKLHKLISARRAKLQKRAFALGRKLYRAKPKVAVQDLSA
jgi:CHAD domain-containing protein